MQDAFFYGCEILSGVSGERQPTSRTKRVSAESTGPDVDWGPNFPAANGLGSAAAQVLSYTPTLVTPVGSATSRGPQVPLLSLG